MAERSIRVRFLGDISNLRGAMVRAGSEVKTFGRELSGQGKSASAQMEKIGKSSLVMAGVIGAGLALSTKAAIDWESAWAGVTKTVDGSASELSNLEAGLRDMAKELPATHGEIAAVAEAAGALGIKTPAIEGFTRTMIDLGETTDLTADQAATSFARIANVMGTSQSDFDRMGSTIVALGNSGASTESEIAELAQRLSAAGAIAGLSEADVFGFAETLSAVGVEAEAGGTALSKVFTAVRDAVLDGSDKLDVFAETAGMTAQQFSTAFREDAAGAIASFVEGIGRVNDAGESTTAIFSELELTDQRLMRALLSTGEAGDYLRGQLELASAAWEDNNALQTEAEKRYETTAARLEMLRNQVVDFGIDIGQVLLPVVNEMVDVFGTFTGGLAAMPGAVKVAGVGVAGFAGLVAGAVGVTGVLIPKLIQMRNALIAMGAAGRFAAASMPWLFAAGAVIGAVAYAFGQSAKRAEEAEERAKAYAEAIREAGDVAGGVRSKVDELVSGNEDLAEAMDEAGVSGEALAGALAGGDAGFEEIARQITSGGEAAGFSEERLFFLAVALQGARDDAQAGAEHAANLNNVLDGTSNAADNAVRPLDDMAGALGLNAEEAETARTEFEKLLDAYRGAVDPLFGMLDALDANREAMAAEAEARAEGAKRVQEATEAVRDAERDLQDARGREDNADGIAAAEERLADARERLTEAEAEAVPTAEELAEINRRVAETALDVEVAARELAASVRDGTVDVDTAKSMLEEWVEQGKITEGQAADVADQFGTAFAAANDLAGDWVATVYLAGGEEAVEKILALREAMIDTFQAATVDLKVQATMGGGRVLRSAGGLVDENGPMSLRPVGSDRIPIWGTRGEGVVNLRGMQALGTEGLAALNAGVLPSTSTAMSVSNNRTLNFGGQVNLHYPTPEPPSTAIPRALRKIALEASLS